MPEETTEKTEAGVAKEEKDDEEGIDKQEEETETKEETEQSEKTYENTEREKKMSEASDGNWFSLYTTAALLGVCCALAISLYTANKQLQEDKQEYGKIIQELEADLSAANTKVTIALNSEQETKKRTSALEKSLGEMKRETGPIQEILKLKQKELDSSLLENKELLASLSTFEEKVAALLKDLDEQKQKRKMAEMKLKEEEERQNSRDEALEKIKQQVALYKSMEGQLDEMTEKVRKENAALTVELASKSEQESRLNSSLLQLQEENKELSEAKAKLQGHISTLIKEVEENEKEIRKLKEAQEKNDYEHFRTEEKLQVKLEESGHKLKKMKEQRDAFSSEVKLLKEAAQESKQQEAQKEELINSLRNMLSERDSTILDLQAKWQLATEAESKLKESATAFEQQFLKWQRLAEEAQSELKQIKIKEEETMNKKEDLPVQEPKQ